MTLFSRDVTEVGDYIQRDVFLEGVFDGRRQLEMIHLLNDPRFVTVVLTMCPRQLKNTTRHTSHENDHNKYSWRL